VPPDIETQLINIGHIVDPVCAPKLCRPLMPKNHIASNLYISLNYYRFLVNVSITSKVISPSLSRIYSVALSFSPVGQASVLRRRVLILTAALREKGEYL
jgi:hypothetical protein